MQGLFPGQEKMPVNELVYKQLLTDHKFAPEYAVKCIEAKPHN